MHWNLTRVGVKLRRCSVVFGHSALLNSGLRRFFRLFCITNILFDFFEELSREESWIVNSLQ